MTTINAASSSPLFFSEQPAKSVAPEPAPVNAQKPVAPAAMQRSLEEHALSASRTRLGTFELSNAPRSGVRAAPSSSRALPGSSAGRRVEPKHQLYLPGKRRNDRLNGKVVLPHSEIDDDSSLGATHVACRHLAIEYFNSPKKAAFLDAVKNHAAIAGYFAGGTLRATNQDYLRVTGAATLSNSSVVSVDRFDAQVMDIAKAMTLNQQRNADFLVTNTDHVMALNIQIKDLGRVCLSFYDPNNTTNHCRVEGMDFKDAALRTITKAIAAYRNDGNHAYTLHAKTDLFSPANALANMASGSKSTPAQVMTSFMGQAFDRNDPGLLMQLIQKAVQDNRRGGPALQQALAAVDQGAPGVVLALQNGRAHIVDAWMHAVGSLAAKGLLTSSQVFELFKAQGPGQPGSGLNLAMVDRKAGTVSVFLANATDTAIAGHLTPVQLKALFTAPDETGTPGIEASWNSADHKTLKAVVQQLERCQQHNLLSAADIRQTVVGDARGMNRSALSGASPDTVKAFEKTLRPLVRSGALNKDDVKSLLAAHGFRK